MTKTAERIIDEDIRKIYLGNLNTVEFDLNLPKEGQQGTQITWFSDNELYLRPDGTVTRPMNGVGDRKVHLRGCFSYAGIKKEKIYEVHILEEESQVKIVEILPLERTVEQGVQVELPQAVVVRGDNEQLFSRSVEWKGGNTQLFNECKDVELIGSVKGEELSARLVIHVRKNLDQARKNPLPTVFALDRGETHLLKGTVFYDSMERDTCYLQNISANQMLYNFREAAGLDTCGAETLDGWDSPECLLRGHTTGHFLSALSLCFRETGNENIKSKLHYMVNELGKCQDAFSVKEGYQEGYLGAYSEEQFDLLEKGVQYPDIWAPYYTLHKLLAGMLDAYLLAGEEKALEIAIRIGKWVYRRLGRLSSQKRKKMWDTYIAGEFGGMNEAFAKLYIITQNKEFLETARMFENDRLFIPMEEKKDVLGGLHANQHIPQIIGCMELFRATGEKRYYDIAEFFWETVVNNHTYANGGVGENEMFFEADASARYLTNETTEYCASYNMMKLTKSLYLYNPMAMYMDYYERCMFNHIVAGVDDKPNGKTSYFFPLAPGGKKEIKFENSCCHGTGMESQMKYTESIFFHTSEEMYINLFLDSETSWKEKEVKIIQTVDKKNPGHVNIQIEGEKEFVLKIRCPYWCNGNYKLMVNNREVIAKCGEDGYINIKINQIAEHLEMWFQCKLHTEAASGNEDIRTWSYGPYLLAAINDRETFLELDMMQPRMEEGNDLKFFTNKNELVEWVPLYNIGNRKYHVYWKRSCP